MMNREQRRRYAKQIKNDRRASICPACNNRSLFKSQSLGGDVVITCETCDAVVRNDPGLARSIPPNIYLPFPLHALDVLLKMKEDEERQKQENADKEFAYDPAGKDE